MNVVQLAKAHVAQESASGEARSHAHLHAKHRGPMVIEGELIWFGEFTDPEEVRPYKMKNGDKISMSDEEIKRFKKTPYERGIMEYYYEGHLRVRTAQPAPRDPRGVIREGTGAMKYAGGEIYEGHWKNHKRHGEGFFSTPTGYRYTGDWVEDAREGKGEEEFSCKSRYICPFENDLPSGSTGSLLYNPQFNPTYHYEGEFHMGYRHGKGTIFYENGDVFQCTWDFGRRHGRGVTNTISRGKEIQYETEWDQDKLVRPPAVIEKVKRTAKPKQQGQYSAQPRLQPADLTKWKVKDDVTDLPMEHFIRIKLGFEKLDVNGSGSLSTQELTDVWGDGSQSMLQKLDADGNGTVELDEIFAAWYPNVPQHTIQRFMAMDINPRALLRIRGYLAGVRCPMESGYFTVVGIANFDMEEDKPLLQKHLERSDYKIGGERFPLALYEAAKVLCDPPHFLEVLEAWYPNIPPNTLKNYELNAIPPEELDDIRTAFSALSKNGMELEIEDFEAAQDLFRQGADMEATIQLQEGVFKEILARAKEGFFKGQPMWRLGSIRLTVVLLNEIDKFDRKIGGSISLHQLLRFCFPNIRCVRTQEALTGKKKSIPPKCDCQICSLT